MTSYGGYVPESRGDDTEMPDDDLLHGPNRIAAIAGMRRLLDLLEAEPDIPVGPNMFRLSFYPEHHGATDTADAVAWLGQIADPLDVEITDSIGDGVPSEETAHYHARRCFDEAENVAYEAMHITNTDAEARTS